MLLMDAHSAVRNYAIRTLAHSPNLFRSLLKVHTGGETFPHILLQNGAEMLKRCVCLSAQKSDPERAST